MRKSANRSPTEDRSIQFPIRHNKEMEATSELFSGNQELVPLASTVAELRVKLVAANETLQSLLGRSLHDAAFSIFHLMDKIREHDKSKDEAQVSYAFRLLFLCAAFEERLFAGGTVDEPLRLGGVERISLHYWRDFLDRSDDTSLRDFVRILLEQHIISQHLSVAARRYDGGTQRLRISIEEEGLVPLVRDPLPLNVTEDRLHSALSLMADCGKIYHDANSGTFMAYA